MKKVLILSDSLSLPRLHPEIVRSEQTWPFLLRSAYPHVYFHQIALGGGLMRDIRSQMAYQRHLRPELVIAQLGIVDCAPRALRKTEQFFVSEYRIIGKIARRILPRLAPFLRKHRRIVYTSPWQFEQEIGIIQGQFGGVPVFWIGIIPARPGYEERVPGISENIARYNRIIQKNLPHGFIGMDHMPDEGIMSDHHHLNKTGHRYIFGKVKQKVHLHLVCKQTA